MSGQTQLPVLSARSSIATSGSQNWVVTAQGECRLETFSTCCVIYVSGKRKTHNTRNHTYRIKVVATFGGQVLCRYLVKLISTSLVVTRTYRNAVAEKRQYQCRKTWACSKPS